MKFSHLLTFTFAVIFALGVIPSTEAVKCYNCVYLQGSYGTAPQCESDTKNVTSQNCGTRGSDELFTVTAAPSYLYSQNSILAMKTLCGSGKGTINGKKVVIRGCVFPAESSHDGKCNKYYDWWVDFYNGTVLRFPANGTNALETCLCSKDDCNGQNNVNGLYSGVTVTVLGTFLAVLRKLY
ncbi:uncharacterized protein LOC110850112 [Folsomia candida]|uniref:RNA-binding protein 27 n=1 Tax=Folsomia candida TaxID=158441 RepID=A0A226E8M1_FOLCA|nr:uncharacterized protein LOC110850112 [Folsomia candida]OXA53387.1 RNA-binding protein 27 [Folsomia candida]